MDTLMEIYAEADADSNGLLNESELEHFIHEVTETMFEDHDEHGHEGGVCYNLATHMTNNDSEEVCDCLLYTSPSPRDGLLSRMPSSA